MYPYPQRPGNMGPPSSAFSMAASSPLSSPHQQPYMPPAPPIVAPIPGYISASSGSVSILRLKLAEDVRMEPPVIIPSTLLPARGPQAAAAFELGLEREIIAATASDGGNSADSGEMDSAADGAIAYITEFMSNIKPGQLPHDAAVQHLEGAGLSSAAAALGTVYARAGRGGADKAADFASNLEKLIGMGFPLSLATGALARHGNEVAAATETCLALGS